MTGRITTSQLNARTLSDLQAVQARQATAAREVATGRRISQPADDPSATRDALRARTVLEQSAAHRSAVQRGTDWTETTDTALGQVTGLIHRARELTVQGANTTTGTAGRAKIAAELTHIVDGLKEAMNAKVGDRYVFSGTATTTPPYTTGSDAYGGDSGLVALEVGPGVSVGVNTLGSAVLGDGTDGRLLETLRDTIAHLTADDVASLGTTDLRALDANLTEITGLRAGAGAAQNRLEAADVRLADLESVTTRMLRDAEGTDMAAAITRWNAEQSAYQAALQVSAKVISPSLLDFLR